jgi:hypothetical protein
MAEADREHPKARRARLVVEALLADETLVYDLDRDEAHSLNPTASFVWHSCDGITPVSEIARRLGQKHGARVSETVVWDALEQLAARGLLDHRPAQPREVALSRRGLMQAAGLTAIVTTLTAPLPAHAQSSLTTTLAPTTTVAPTTVPPTTVPPTTVPPTTVPPTTVPPTTVPPTTVPPTTVPPTTVPPTTVPPTTVPPTTVPPTTVPPTTTPEPPA